MKHASIALIAFGIFSAIFTFLTIRPLVPPKVGPTGARRIQSRADVEWFRRLEPALVILGAWYAFVPLTSLKKHVDEVLRLSGHWLGLRADEFLALSTLTAIGGAIAGIAVATIAEQPPAFGFVFGALCGILPYSSLKTALDTRRIDIVHGLPESIDLLALCMGAGLDFPGAIREIIDKAPSRRDALIEEFRMILQDLELGRTRQAALQELAQRVPVESVKDFVSSVVQAEQKGTPLASVLAIQGQIMRNQRAVRAEESAAKAATLLLGPLMLIMVFAMILLVGPFVVQMSEQPF